MHESSLAAQIKVLRRRFGVKQAWLAHATGCSAAAVSLWEHGKRVPYERTMARIVRALEDAGSPPGDIARLRESWHESALEGCRATAMPTFFTPALAPCP